MQAIKYFHSRNIVHRDLKLENIMIEGVDKEVVQKYYKNSKEKSTDKYFKHDKKDLKIKLIDFGMSKITGKGKKMIEMRTSCGTIDFMAPEVIEGESYDSSCDIWSIGVISYFMLSGNPPFIGIDDLEIQRNICSCNFDFDE